MKFFAKIFAAVILAFVSFACTKPGTADFDVQFAVPGTVSINFNDTEMEFRVMFSKAPLQSDVVILGDPTGKLHTCAITSVSPKSFKIALYDNLVSGVHNVYIQRGSQKKFVGSMEVFVTYTNTDAGDIEVKEGNNVYGLVSCGGKGIPGVVVSDGYEVVMTDADGVYQFKSNKVHGYVFVSVPSGYEAISEGVMPKLHHFLTKPKSEVERVDFPLVESAGQDNHTMLVFGDIHLANRTNDARQFAEFTADVNDYLAANPGKKTYALTLGDMTWELYWVSNKYSFDEYIRDINKINGIKVFNTIGNHDHEMAVGVKGDFDTVIKYKKAIAPTYYSFNIGKVHYIVLDDINCTNTGAGDANSRQYDDYVVKEQLDWLKKDLSFVSTSTPLVITMHAPLYNDSDNGSLNNTSEFEEIVKSYTTHVWTGHTHKMYNVDKLSAKKVFEHNAGAVCATWWWTGNWTPGLHLAQDGAPGGYSIINVTGTDFKWKFKGTGRDSNHQFRTYDRNQFALTADTYVASTASAANKKKFEDAVGDWKNVDKGNYVYINVWNYDPQWTISATENGTSLKVDRVSAKDPLHLIAYNGKSPTGGFGTSVTKHLFRVQATSATSTLEIKVTDRFGNVYTESMKRPKAFSLNAYK